MAESKNSFILYADMIHQFENLDDAEAGKLIKIIFDYVNDKNPVVEDRVLKIAFEPIKRQLKRDLCEWNITRGERSKSGTLGNLKRWNNDIYEQVINKKITLEEGVKLANSRKPSLSDNSESLTSLPIANVANIAVNGTVTVTENVNVTVNETLSKSASEFFIYQKEKFDKYPENFIKYLKDKHNIYEPIVYSTDRAGDQYRDLVEIIYDTMTDKPWSMRITRKHPEYLIKKKLEEFINWQLESDTYRNEKYLSHHEFKQHFVNKVLSPTK